MILDRALAITHDAAPTVDPDATTPRDRRGGPKRSGRMSVPCQRVAGRLQFRVRASVRIGRPQPCKTTTVRPRVRALLRMRQGDDRRRMKLEGLTGTYTYRSFHNVPDLVDDFNRLRFAQLELRLEVEPTGTLSGKLMFSDEPEIYMALTGELSGSEPVRLVFTGRGLPGTDIADFHYEYDAVLLSTWTAGVGQVATLAGTVLRASAHGAPPNVVPAGYTASFLAVRRAA